MNKPRKIRTFVGLYFLSLLTSFAMAADGRVCKALVNSKDELWLVSQDGTIARQMTNDGQFKNAASISPTGSVIAYSTDFGSRDKISFIDSQGRLISSFTPETQDAIVRLEWASPTLLKAYEHINPSNSVIHFINFQQDSGSAVALGTAEGGKCSLSPNGKEKVCVSGGTVTNNDKVIYYVPSSFSSVVDLQTVVLSNGRSLTTSTSPAFRVQAEIQSDKTVALKVTTPDGQTQEQYVRKGDTMPVIYPVDNNRVVFGFYPTISASDDQITLRIVKSKIGQIALEGGVAWANSGQTIAVVEVNDLQQARLVLMNSESAAISKEKTVIFSSVLPVSGPVSALEITPDNRLRVTTSSSVFEQSLAKDLRGFSGDYTLTPSLPSQLNFTSGTSPVVGSVYGWACY